ncbi:MAG TPA: STAS domain-containing protein [Cellvibrionaceae bacterium]|nr:STAS domain-containing protein [Cellvibrionaceae bacterium]HMW48819.1 STAS domain-containing protein [Cellvibrionaceae bacterium]HMW72908.1 STAS domain-containing protein [Cellvibrionaceae bacterium]HNG60031.1 STAS domain-containing protein [Cellvibrionaceae bacterium]
MSSAQLQCVDNTLSLSGLIDHTSVVSLLQQGQQFVSSADPQELIVDWAQVAYANSAALAMVLQWTRQAQAAGKSLRSQNVPEFLVQLARVSQLEFLFT